MNSGAQPPTPANPPPPPAPPWDGRKWYTENAWWVDLLFFIPWVLLFILFLCQLAAGPTRTLDTPDEQSSAVIAGTVVGHQSGTALTTAVAAVAVDASKKTGPRQLDPLKVFQKSDAYAALPREKAVEFSLDKVATFVNYLLLAAAGVLGFSVKFVTDLRSELAKPPAERPTVTPQRWQLLLFLHAAIGCFFSLICGVAAYGYLPIIATYETFSIYNQLATCVMYQSLTLLFALFLLLISLARVLFQLLPSP